MNSEWVEYERGACERAEAVQRSKDSDIRAAIAAIDARKRKLAREEAAALAARLAELDD